MQDRRQFLKRAAAISFASWIGAEMAHDSNVAADVPSRQDTAGGILQLGLRATRIDAQSQFYGEVMGWPVKRSGRDLWVSAGGTRIHFEPAAEGTSPRYHIAWAIPCNKFDAGKRWLAKRATLLRAPDGRDEFHFRGANRRGVYFADPEGSILELIARDDLGDITPGPFTRDDLLHVNHVGLVVDNMTASIRALGESCGLGPTAPPLPTFTKLGDAYRHVVLVPRGRLWFPEQTLPAEVFPTEVILQGGDSRHHRFENLPYRVVVSADLPASSDAPATFESAGAERAQSS